LLEKLHEFEEDDEGLAKSVGSVRIVVGFDGEKYACIKDLQDLCEHAKKQTCNDEDALVFSRLCSAFSFLSSWISRL
jgi:hypothetical protein